MSLISFKLHIIEQVDRIACTPPTLRAQPTSTGFECCDYADGLFICPLPIPALILGRASTLCPTLTPTRACRVFRKPSSTSAQSEASAMKTNDMLRRSRSRFLTRHAPVHTQGRGGGEAWRVHAHLAVASADLQQLVEDPLGGSVAHVVSHGRLGPPSPASARAWHVTGWPGQGAGLHIESIITQRLSSLACQPDLAFSLKRKCTTIRLLRGKTCRRGPLPIMRIFQRRSKLLAGTPI